MKYMRLFISRKTVQLVCIQLYTILKCFNNVKVAKGEQYWWKEHKREQEYDIVALIYVPEKLMLVYFVKTW